MNTHSHSQSISSSSLAPSSSSHKSSQLSSEYKVAKESWFSVSDLELGQPDKHVYRLSAATRADRPTLADETIPYCVTSLTVLAGILLTCTGLAFTGLLDLLIGHAILRAFSHHPALHAFDVSLVASMDIGSVGGVVTGVAIFSLVYLCVRTGGSSLSWWRIVVSCVGLIGHGAASGALGSIMLRKHLIDGGALNYGHAAAAGALGSVVILPVFVLLHVVMARRR